MLLAEDCVAHFPTTPPAVPGSEFDAGVEGGRVGVELTLVSARRGCVPPWPDALRRELAQLGHEPLAAEPTPAAAHNSLYKASSLFRRGSRTSLSTVMLPSFVA